MAYTVDSALEKLIYQYRHSGNVRGLIRALLEEYETAYGVGETLYTRLDIAESFGQQLDGIGDIVGRARPLTEQIESGDAFTFAGATGKGFSGVGRPDIGGRLVGVGGLIIGAMGDEDYRTLLRATIIANYADSTIENIGEYVAFILGAEAGITQGVGFIDLTFPRPLGPTELRIIDAAIPVAAGIRVRYKTYSLDTGAFSFAGNVNGTGFDTVYRPPVYDEQQLAFDEDLWTSEDGETLTALASTDETNDPIAGAGFVGLING